MAAGCLVLSILIPPLGIPLALIGLSRNNKNWRYYAFSICLALAILAYCYEPNMETDLTRYFTYIETLGKLSFKDAFMYNNFGEYGLNGGQSIVVFTFVCWVAGRIGDVHLVPALSVFVVYYISFYLLYSIGDDYKIKNKYIFQYVIFLLMSLNFYAVVNNVRNVCAFCLVALASFRDCYQKKRNIVTFVLYVIPLLIHPTSFFLILLRFALVITSKVRVLIVSLVVLVKPIISLFYTRKFRYSNFFRRLIIKSYNYFFDTSSEWGLTVKASVSENMFRFLYIGIGVMLCVGSFFLVVRLKKDLSENDEHTEGLIRYTDLLFGYGLMTIACTPMLRPEYWRFATLQIGVSGSTYIILKSKENKNVFVNILITAMFAFGIAGMVLWMRNLLRYMDVVAVFGKTFISSPIIIAVMDLLNQFI
jgi:hypothetical protein